MWRGSWGNTEPFAEIRGQTTTNPPKKSCRTAILRSDQLFLCACISDFALQIDPDPLVPDHGVWKMAVEALGILACGNKAEQRLHALCLQSRPTWENFPVLRGNSREWDGSRHGSTAHHSHSTAAPKHRKKYPFRGDFFKSGMDRFIVQPHIIPTRSRQAYSKQVCLWVIAQIICIVFIIQIV